MMRILTAAGTQRQSIEESRYEWSTLVDTLEQEVGADGLQRSPATSAIVWLCKVHQLRAHGSELAGWGVWWCCSCVCHRGKQSEESSYLQILILIGPQFFYHLSMWRRDNSEGHRQSGTFLENTGDEFITGMTEEQTSRAALLCSTWSLREGTAQEWRSGATSAVTRRWRWSGTWGNGAEQKTGSQS